jgi:outer membrane protein assembly factor BamB
MTLERLGRRILSILLALGAVRAGAQAGGAEANWPAWRGPLASGVAPAGDPPVTWGEGKNVKWKVRIPGEGTSSPIVWGDRIFAQTAISTGMAAAQATPQVFAQQQPRGGQRQPGGGRGGFGGGPKPTDLHRFVLLCIDRGTGKVIWERTVKEEVPHEGHHKDHSFSSYSPVTDGKLVWAYFGSRGLHCFDMDGNPKWQKDLGKMRTKMEFGEGSSPAVHSDVIVVNWDHEGEDFIVAFNNQTGDELWRTPRDEETNWATPLIVEHGGQAQVIVSATKKIRSYDLKTGKQIWEGPGLTANVIPSPVAGNGVVYLTSGFRGNALYAIKLGRTGDLSTSDAILWQYRRATPYVPSPLLSGDRLYLFGANNSGRLSCFDVKSGKPLFENDPVDGLDRVYASPVAAGGKVYLLGRDGTCVVIKDADKLEVLATNKLDEPMDASPAIAGREIILRGKESLYCIAEK